MRSSFIYVFELRTNLTSRSTFVHLRVRFVRSASKLIQPITADAFGAEHSKTVFSSILHFLIFTCFS